MPGQHSSSTFEIKVDGTVLPPEVGSALVEALIDDEITALEAEIERDRTLAIVRGFDHAHRLQRGTTTETHLDVTYGDIVGKVAQRRGLQKGDAGTNTIVHEAV